MKNKIDARRLEADARKSCCKESFIVLERTPIIRIGTGARVGDDDGCLLFIEISLKLCPGKSLSSTVSLEKGVELAKVLRDAGYDVTCDEGQIYFEKMVSRADINREYERALAIIEESGLFGPMTAAASDAATE